MLLSLIPLRTNIYYEMHFLFVISISHKSHYHKKTFDERHDQNRHLGQVKRDENLNGTGSPNASTSCLFSG